MERPEQRRPSTLNPTDGFRYNGRIALAAMPAAAILICGCSSGAGVVISVLGALAAHLFDTLQIPEATLMAIWIAVVMDLFAVLISPAVAGMVSERSLLFTLALAATSSQALSLCGVWASLQIPWVRFRFPAIAIVSEKLLFALLPSVSTVVMSWGILAAIGAANAAFYTLIIATICYQLFTLPAHSSFYGESSTFVLGSVERMIQTILYLFSSALFYFAIYFTKFSTSSVMALLQSSELAALGILASLPIYVVCMSYERGSLDFLPVSKPVGKALATVGAVVSLSVLILSVESRVIFSSFTQFIPLLPPYNYLLVFLTSIGVGCPMTIHFLSQRSAQKMDASDGQTTEYPVSELLASVALVGSAGAGTLVLGAPLYIVPFPLIAAAGMVQFYYSNSLRDYIIFASAHFVSTVWFIWKHFLLLDVEFGEITRHVDLQSICLHLIALNGCLLLLPAFLLIKSSNRQLNYPNMTGFVTALILIGVAKIEDSLYATSPDEESLYPAYIIIATSTMGIALLIKLHTCRRIAPLFSAFVAALCIAKLFVLLFPQDNVVPAIMVFLLSAMPAPTLYLLSSDSASYFQMSSIQGFLNAGMIAIGTFVSRHIIFDLVSLCIDGRPADTMVIGTMIMTIGFCWLLLSVWQFPDVLAARRIAVVSLTAGALLAALRPPLPKGLDWFWDAAHQPISESSDAEFYRGNSATHVAWSSWLLLAALLVTTAALSSAIPVARHPLYRFIYAVVMGLSLGFYVISEFFPSFLPLKSSILVACISSGIFTSFLMEGKEDIPRWIPLAFVLLLTTFPITWVTIPRGTTAYYLRISSAKSEDVEDLINQAPMSVLSLYAALFILISFCVKMRIAAILKSQKQKSSRGDYHHARLAELRRGGGLRQSQLRARKLKDNLQYFPLIGNVSCFLGFSLISIALVMTNEDSRITVFATAPLLLLLNEDYMIIQSLGDRRRYFFVYAILVVSQIFYEIREALLYEPDPLSAGNLSPLWIQQSAALRVIKSVVFIFITLPNHIMFMSLLWTVLPAARHKNDLILLLVTPLNLISVLLGNSLSIAILGVMGGVAAVGHFLITRRVYMKGLKFL